MKVKPVARKFHIFRHTAGRPGDLLTSTRAILPANFWLYVFGLARGSEQTDWQAPIMEFIKSSSEI